MDQLTPFDEDFYPDILRGLSVYFDSPFVLNIARTAQQFRRADLAIALNRKQIASKKWLIDHLYETHGGIYGTIWVLGGWYGVLSALLFEDPRFEVGKILSFDVDPDCEQVADCLNRDHVPSGRFKARTADMLGLDYRTDTPDLIINTSCEHIPDISAWLGRIPEGTLMTLQSNNYFGEPDHLNCVETLEAFQLQAPLSNVGYEGELALKNYTRFMLIGTR